MKKSDTNSKVRSFTLLRKKHVVYVILAIALIGGTKFFSDVAKAEDDTADVPSEGAIPESKKDDGGGLFDGVKRWWNETGDKAKEHYRNVTKEVSVKTGQSISEEKSEELKEEFNTEIDKTGISLSERVSNDVEQIDCLTRALVFEAGGEPELGKLWVLHVIQNRKDLGYRGEDTYCGVIFDRKQFSFANINPDRVPDYTKDLVQSKAMVMDFYFDEDKEDITDCATHYLVSDIADDVDWSKQALDGTSPEDLEKKAVIGNHTFFGPPDC